MHPLPDIDRTKLLVVGPVQRLGPPPGGWTGRFAAYQAVEFGVQAVLKGEPVGPSLAVDYPVVQGSPIAREDEPGLSVEYFAVGRKFVVGVEEMNWRVLATYTQPWTQELEQAVVDFVRRAAQGG